MLPAVPRIPQRLLLPGLVLACVVLAIVIAMVASLMVHRPGSGVAPPERADAVSVFSDGATPSSHVAPAALDAPGSPGAASVFTESARPQTPVDPDRGSVELGVRFAPKVDGTVSAIRFYRTAANTGPHVGTLWGPNGEVLARVSFPRGATTGWQHAEISPAVAVTAGVTYVASYFAPAGRYAADEHYFDEGLDTATLSMPAGAGVYAYGSGAFPSENYRNSNYYVDVAFTPEPTTTPTATPEPTPTATTTPGGVFGDDAEPGLRVDPDRASVELGMRFVPKVDGEIAALRLYRNAANTTALQGTLWDAEGTAIAQADFPAAGEGWQTADLPQPVAVTAGQLYVVSYLAQLGRYAADEHYFDRGIENDYFSVPAGAGVYAYGSGEYPTENYRNSNYYVDVRFAPVDATESTPTPSDTATPPSPPASPQPTVPPGQTAALDLPTEAWWGGPSYYSGWEKAKAAGWDRASFFPLAVFFGKPSHADELADMGINTYMGAEHDGSPISTITDQGISVLAQSEWSPGEIGEDPLVVGWHVSDECDMGYSGCTPDWNNDNGEAGRLEVQKSYVADARALDDGRFVQANFGNGVLGTWWAPETMDDHLALVDVSSVDKYAYTSPHVNSLFRESPSWPDGKEPASAGAYGWQQDRMETFMTPAASKPNWVFVETAKPFLTEAGARTMSGDQIEGAVWNAIIHGAAGLAYFQHNNDESCGTYSLVECSAALRQKVRAINASVTSLAPVINSPSHVWDFGTGLETSLKSGDGYAYILAMTDGGSGTRTFSVPAQLSGSVEVVGEERTLEIANGAFSDEFASENDHHIYRIAIGEVTPR
jgi:hypothetical protein